MPILRCRSEVHSPSLRDYSGYVADIPEAPKAQVGSVLRCRLSAALMPTAYIPRKWEAKQTKPIRPNAKRRG